MLSDPLPLSALDHARAAQLHRAAVAAFRVLETVRVANYDVHARPLPGFFDPYTLSATRASVSAAMRDARDAAEGVSAAARAATEFAPIEAHHEDPHRMVSATHHAQAAARASRESSHCDDAESIRAHERAAIEHETALAFLS